MNISRYDSFENEVEMAELVKNNQKKSLEYMKRHDAWEFGTTNPISTKKCLNTMCVQLKFN